MARWDRARWEPCGNFSGSTAIRSVCLHHQAGWGDPLSVYESRGVSAHFWIPQEGGPIQHVDTANRAWHGGTDALNTYAIGVETEGCGSPPHADPLTDNQLDLFAELMAWAHDVHGVPLVLSESATTPGLNYHRCQGGYATGCPCDVRVAARAEILARAGAQPAPPSPAPGPPPSGSAAPPWPGRYLSYPPVMQGTDVHTWQAQMAARGWQLAVDGQYGQESALCCEAFQLEKGLAAADGVVGPDTWAAAWEAPIT